MISSRTQRKTPTSSWWTACSPRPDSAQYLIQYNVDRTNTLGQVWLGMTLGCAECHSHKYDPISHKEYYQLFAYFTGIKEPAVTGLHNAPLPPILKMPSAEQAKTMA